MNRINILLYDWKQTPSVLLCLNGFHLDLVIDLLAQKKKTFTFRCFGWICNVAGFPPPRQVSFPFPCMDIFTVFAVPTTHPKCMSWKIAHCSSVSFIVCWLWPLYNMRPLWLNGPQFDSHKEQIFPDPAYHIICFYLPIHQTLKKGTAHNPKHIVKYHLFYICWKPLWCVSLVIVMINIRYAMNSISQRFDILKFVFLRSLSTMIQRKMYLITVWSNPLVTSNYVEVMLSILLSGQSAFSGEKNCICKRFGVGVNYLSLYLVIHLQYLPTSCL